ncbi:MAG: GntR family transcriptional regulator [Acidimicrobiales bacterium]
MILRVDTGDAVPVYEQIRLQLTAMIASGTLPPGSQLPTIRQLAADLGLAKGTVSKAYEMLLRDRAVESRGRSGTVVSSQPVNQAAARQLVADAADRLVVTAVQNGLDRDATHAALEAALARLS